MLVGYKSFGNCGNPLTSGELWVEGCPGGRAPRARLSQKGRSILSPLLPTPTLGQCSIKALLLIKPPVVLFVNAPFPEIWVFLATSVGGTLGQQALESTSPPAGRDGQESRGTHLSSSLRHLLVLSKLSLALSRVAS